jgi:Second Messenger Oligonucleotide or Dinucleotide Synthetase domain
VVGFELTPTKIGVRRVETLPQQFEDALRRIEISSDRRAQAMAAHEEVRSLLEAGPGLLAWGVDTTLIGSYSRSTAIHPGKDVDVFVRLTELDRSTSPEVVFEAVRDVLVAQYGPRASAQTRSVKIDFDSDGEGFAVDAVPAVHAGQRWAIPDRDTARWSGGASGEGWVETDPERLGKLTTATNSGVSVGGRGAYVPTVKLLRQTRRHHLDEARPGGLYFELLAYWAFDHGVGGGSFAELLAAALRYAANQLVGSEQLVDPAIGSAYDPQPNPAERAMAAECFDDLATRAETALMSSRCKAAVLWRGILGENARGRCFPIPAGCDEDGHEMKNIFAVAATGSQEPAGFAADRGT